ncbi:MAG: molybdopterin-dependent oxidoreductase [Candidatus Hodarchaeota archaeon]
MNKSSVLFLIILGLCTLPLIAVISIGEKEQTITPNDEFFTISISSNPPEINASLWTLKIEGLVANPFIFTYANFTTQPTKELIATLKCVEGPSATAKWRGVPLKDVLDRANVLNEAIDVIFHAADGYTSSLSISEARADDILLAFEMNGESLPVEHGFPVRVVAPNYAGYKWVKWVMRIEVVDYDHLGYWESYGWSDDARFPPERDWKLHALLLSISFIFGSLALMSGLKFSVVVDIFHDLPAFISRRFHLFVSGLYVITSLIVFSYWVIQTIIFRGGVFYTLHGIIGLGAVIFGIIGVATGMKKIRQDPKKQSWHRTANIWSFTLYLLTIFLGFLLTASIYL